MVFLDSTGIVLYSSRRFVEIFSPANGKYYLGTIGQRGLEITPGDIVNFTLDKAKNSEEHVIVNSIIDRKNLLKRSYDKKTKLLAANLDSLWIITAPPPLFNSIAIDRTISAANNENIPIVLIANKSDLDEFQEFKNQINFYKKLVSELIYLSAIKKVGLEQLPKNTGSELKIIAVAGISGVGKSSLISSLYPETLANSGDVSTKTGQGKQTTSAAKGYVVEYIPNERITVLIDLPGIQNYGVSHLEEQEIIFSMRDIFELSQKCRFRDCKHLKEPECNVRNSLEKLELPESRYRSLLDMLSEKKKLREY